MLKIRECVFLSLATTIFVMNATAGVLREDKSDGDWEILLAPYLWGDKH